MIRGKTTTKTDDDEYGGFEPYDQGVAEAEFEDHDVDQGYYETDDFSSSSSSSSQEDFSIEHEADWVVDQHDI